MSLPTVAELRAFAAVVRVLGATAGRSAFVRGAPLYFGIALGAAVLFGGNGMNAATVTDLATRSLPFRLSLFLAWTLVTLPVARILLTTPSTFLLRALPVPRWQHLLVHLAHLSVAELPFVLLWARGGAVAGAAAWSSALAAHGLLLCRPRRPVELAALSLLGVGLGQARPGLLLSASLPGLVIGTRAAWLRAPQREAPRDVALVAGAAPFALGLSYLAGLLRGHGALLLRCLLYTTLGCVITWLALRNNGVTGAAPTAVLSLTLATPPLLACAGTLAGPVLRSERQLRWLLLCCGTPPAQRVIATCVVVATVCGLCGAAHGATVGYLVAAELPLGLRLSGGSAAAGLLLGTALTSGLRWALRGDKRDTDRAFLSIIVAVVAASLSAALMGELALLLWAVVAGLLGVLLAPPAQGSWEQRRAEQAERRAERAP